MNAIDIADIPYRRRTDHHVRKASERLCISARPTVEASIVVEARGGAAARSTCPQKGWRENAHTR